MYQRLLCAAAVAAASSALAFAGNAAAQPALAAAPHATAGPGTQQWASRYGSSTGNNAASSVAVDPSGHAVYVTGEAGAGASRNDYGTVAYNTATGTQLWASRYHGPGNGTSEAFSVAADPRGGSVFVTGYSDGGASGKDYATVAYNATTGAQLWASRYNGPANGADEAASVAVSPDGRTVFVTGYSDGGASGDDYATVAYNATTGAQLWASRYNGPANGGDEAFSVGVSPDGTRVFVTGGSWGGASRDDFATVAYNAATGTQEWAARYNDRTNNGDTAFSLAVSPAGNAVFVTGQRTAGIGFRYQIVAYNAATGAQLWARVSRHRSDNSANSVAVSPGGGTVFITGYLQTESGYDYLTVAYTVATGARKWQQTYTDGFGTDNSASQVVAGPGGTTVFVTGRSDNSGDTSSDYATVACNAATGAQRWASRYHGPGNGDDYATSLAVNQGGTAVFVTGESKGANSKYDYATVAYDASGAARDLPWTAPDGRAADQ